MSTSKRTWDPCTWSPCTPGHGLQALRRPVGLGGDGRAGQLAQRVERARLHRAAGADDAHPIAERLDLGEDVARQQHRAALVADLLDAGLEHRLHQRVEAGGRLVEDQQLGRRRQARDQRHLLPVALRVGAGPLRGVELEAPDELVPSTLVDVAAEAGEQVDHLAAGELGPQAHVAGHVGEAAVQLDGVPPRVAPEQLHVTGVGAQEAEQHADGRRLARAVGTEEAVHLARLHHEVEAVERSAAIRTSSRARRWR